MTELLFTVAIDGASPDELDAATRALRTDLIAVPGVDARLRTAAAPPDTKSGLATEIGHLVVSSGGFAAVVPPISLVVLRFIDRWKRAGSIRVRHGDAEIVIDRPTDGQVDAVVAQLRGLLVDDRQT